jgi:basic amino acid/polyamine antiporter, APA family
MARRELLRAGLGGVHERFLSPQAAIAFISALTVLGALLGDAALVPISELGALAIAVGWLMACVSFLKGASWDVARPSRAALVVAAMGAVVACGMVLMKVLPFVPGHMTWPQLACLAAWTALGLALRPGGLRGRPVSEGNAR